jgi:hypothetical protein
MSFDKPFLYLLSFLKTIKIKTKIPLTIFSFNQEKPWQGGSKFKPFNTSQTLRKIYNSQHVLFSFFLPSLSKT